MHRLTRGTFVLSMLAFIPMAFAEDKATAKPEGPPKPAPALVEAFKGMTGTWACKGKFQKMDGSGEMDSKSTMVMRSELEGFLYSGDFRMPKNAEMPNGMKAHMHWSYDAANNKLVEFAADTFGGVGRGTSDGMKGDTIVWDEDGVEMGKSTKDRTTLKRVGPKEIALTFERQADGKWTPMGHTTCKKT